MIEVLLSLLAAVAALIGLFVYLSVSAKGFSK